MTVKNLLVALTLALATLIGTGCESQERTVGLDEPVVAPPQEEEGFFESLAFWEEDEERLTEDDVLSNMSPALMTRPDTPGEVDIEVARTIDTNGRSAWRDLMRVLLLDEPSRLSPYPTP